MLLASSTDTGKKSFLQSQEDVFVDSAEGNEKNLTKSAVGILLWVWCLSQSES